MAIGFFPAAIVAAWALCGTPSPTRIDLTLAEAMRRASGASPEARLAGAEVEIARAEVAGARPLLPANPALRATAGARNDSALGEDWSAGAEVSLYVPGQRGARLSAARARLHAADARVRQARIDLGVRGGAAFLDALAASELERIARDADRLAESLLDAVRIRVETGVAGGLDLHLARVQRAHAALALLDVTRRSAEALAELRRQLAIPETEEIELVGSLETRLAAPAVEAKRADRVAADLEVVAARRDLLAARLDLLPRPTLSADVSRDDGDDVREVGASIEIPLFQSNAGARRAARAEIGRAEAKRTAIEAGIAADAATARARLEAAARAESLFDDEMVASLDAILAMAPEAYAAGKLTFAQLMDVRREALELKMRHVESAAELRKAELESMRAAGVAPWEAQ